MRSQLKSNESELAVTVYQGDDFYLCIKDKQRQKTLLIPNSTHFAVLLQHLQSENVIIFCLFFGLGPP